MTRQPFSQQTWLRQWSDSPATPIAASYSGAIALVNAGAITERWAIQFTNTTSFQVMGEHVGVIAVGMALLAWSSRRTWQGPLPR